MAISFLGEQKLPTVDDANETSATCTLDKDVAPFSTLAVNDLVIVTITFKAGAGTTCSVTTTGGQTWAEDVDANNNNTNLAIYTCFFNGTWTADPVFTSSGAASPRVMWAAAYRGVEPTARWDVTPVVTAQAASTTFVEATWNTGVANALALVGAQANDNNTWSVDNSFTAPSGSGNIYWRTAGGTDASHVLTTKTIASAGAVGATTMTQVTLGGDAGARWHASLNPAKIVDGVVLTITPSLPTGTLNHTITGTVLSVTPSLPVGAVNTGAAGQTVDGTGFEVTATPTLPTGALTHTLIGVVLTVTPSLPTGTLNHSLTGVVVTATPTLPTGSLAHSITGTVLTVTPTLPTGALAHTVTGTVLTVTPSLPAGQVTIPGAQTVTGVVLTITPTLPVGALAHTLTGTVLTVVPTLPTGSLALPQTVTGIVLTVTPSLPIGVVTTVVMAGPVPGPTQAVVVGPNAAPGTEVNQAVGSGVNQVVVGAGGNQV